ncbi:type VII secretion integral membrane protein EccD [Aestuariimicrobium ganziense]|uniref:type VII secretion integral membrane protein EccD n=1 Tax=Aestuariimicrobium ganziense TaxID=2773677 RepID=UPI001942B4D2|nr:type VII secretion integral membrane protein EccD [Aestuariimicrobium ganziense]
MSSATEEDISRVTVISPQRRVDLALPGSVTLGELLPSIVKFAGYEASNTTDAVHNWVLQRFGEDPLDAGAQVSTLGINDGETLHLRQRENAMPDAAFDDVVDAVSTSTAQRPSWHPRHSQRMALGVLVILLLGLPMMVLFGLNSPDKVALWGRLITPAPEVSLAAAATCLVLAFASVITSISISRAAGEYRVSSTFAWAAVVLAFFGGYGMLSSSTPVATRLTLALAAVLVTAAACALAASVQVMGLFTAAVTSGVLLAATATMVLFPGRELVVCAVGLTVMVAVTSMLPTFSYRLARIALPAVPPDAQAMMADDTPVQSDIVTRALLADRLLASLLIATSVTTLVLSLPLLLGDASWWTLSLCGVVALAMLLRARAFVGLQQRLSLLSAGTLVMLLAFSVGVGRLPATVQLAVAGAVAVVAVLVLAGYATAQYSKIITPVWGRLGDVMEWLAIMAIVPLLLGVLDLYDKFRALGG